MVLSTIFLNVKLSRVFGLHLLDAFVLGGVVDVAAAFGQRVRPLLTYPPHLTFPLRVV